MNEIHDIYPLLLCGGCCCQPTPAIEGGVPPARFTVHPASSAVTPVGFVHKSRGDNVVCVRLMMCVVYVSVPKGTYW